MSVGSVLVQPQRVRRAASIDAEFAVLDDLLLVATRTFADAVVGGDIHASAAGRVRRVGGAGRGAGRGRLPGRARAPGAALGVAPGRARAADRGVHVRRGLRPASSTGCARCSTGSPISPRSVTADTIREPIEELVDIVQVDFGLTPDFLDDEVRTLFDDAVARLEDIPDDADDDERSNRLAVARALRRLRNRIRGELVFPELDASLLGDELFRWLERTGVLGAVAKFACVARTAADAFTVGESVVELVPFTGFGGGSVGAAAAPDDRGALLLVRELADGGEGTASWYFAFIPLLPADEVWRTKDGHIDAPPAAPPRRRPSREQHGRLDEGVHLQPRRRPRRAGERSAWGPRRTRSASRTSRRRSRRSPTSARSLVNAFEMVFHLISLEEGDYASNAFNAFTNAGIATVKLATGNPMDWWLDVLVFRGAGTVMTSLEGTHRDPTPRNWLKMWLTLLGPDLGRGDRVQRRAEHAPRPRARVHDAAKQRLRTRARSPVSSGTPRTSSTWTRSSASSARSSTSSS